MVIFLKFSVSGNAISIVATHMSLFTDLFAFISFKSRLIHRTPLHIFTDYQKVTNFITVLYWTLIVF